MELESMNCTNSIILEVDKIQHGKNTLLAKGKETNSQCQEHLIPSLFIRINCTCLAVKMTKTIS